MIYVIMYRGVYRSEQRLKTSWPILALTFVAGAVSAGAAFGFLLGAVGGALDEEARLLIVAALAAGGVAVGALGLFGRQVPLVQLNRETPREWLFDHPLLGTFGTGGLIGAGFLTRVGFWLWYVVPVAAFASGSGVLGASIFGAYAATRSLVPALLVAGAQIGSGNRRGHVIQGLLTNRVTAVRGATLFLLVMLSTAYLA